MRAQVLQVGKPASQEEARPEQKPREVGSTTGDSRDFHSRRVGCGHSKWPAPLPTGLFSNFPERGPSPCLRTRPPRSRPLALSVGAAEGASRPRSVVTGALQGAPMSTAPSLEDSWDEVPPWMSAEQGPVPAAVPSTVAGDTRSTYVHTVLYR